MGLDSLWLEFELWQSEDGSPAFDPENDSSNVKAVVDGVSYCLNVWTYKFLPEAIQEEAGSGKRYLLPPDLFVERLDRALIEAAIQEMIREGQLSESWRVKEDDLAETPLDA